VGPHPSFVTPAPSEVEARCAGCDGPVRSSEPGGFWVLDGSYFHPGCASWDERPFPYAWAVEAGRRAVARLTRSGITPDDSLLRAVEWLSRAARRWPGEDPVRILHIAARAAQVIGGVSRALTDPGAQQRVTS
jgi:hypothetical protein